MRVSTEGASAVQCRLLREVDSLSGGNLFEQWLEKDISDRSGLVDASDQNSTLTIADAILSAEFTDGFLSEGEASGAISCLTSFLKRQCLVKLSLPHRSINWTQKLLL